MRSGPVAVAGAWVWPRQRKVSGRAGRSGAKTGSGRHISSGRGRGDGGQSPAGEDHAAAMVLVVFSGMWLSAGCWRVIWSRPTRADARHQVIKGRGAVLAAGAGGGLGMAGGLAGVDGFHAGGLKPELVDAEARVDLVKLHGEQWRDLIGPVAGAGKAGGEGLAGAVAARHLKPQVARALTLVAQALAKGGHHPVKRGQKIVAQPDGIGEGEAHGKAGGWFDGRNGFGHSTHGLIQPQGDFRAEATRQRRAGLAQKVA